MSISNSHIIQHFKEKVYNLFCKIRIFFQPSYASKVIFLETAANPELYLYSLSSLETANLSGAQLDNIGQNIDKILNNICALSTTAESVQKNQIFQQLITLSLKNGSVGKIIALAALSKNIENDSQPLLTPEEAFCILYIHRKSLDATTITKFAQKLDLYQLASSDPIYFSKITRSRLKTFLTILDVLQLVNQHFSQGIIPNKQHFLMQKSFWQDIFSLPSNNAISSQGLSTIINLFNASNIRKIMEEAGIIDLYNNFIISHQQPAPKPTPLFAHIFPSDSVPIK
jgi:hypothetical protein